MGDVDMSQLSEEDKAKLTSLNKKDAGDNSEQEAKIQAEQEAAEEKFVGDWSGILLIGPFIPSVFAAISIPIGQYVLATWDLDETEECDVVLDSFVTLAMVCCYFLLIIYSWVWLGFTYRLKVPYTKTFYTITLQFSSMYWVAGAYVVLGVFSFIVWIFGAYLLNNAILCGSNAPTLYSFAVYLSTIYWLGFTVVALVLINQIFGEEIKAFVKDQMDEPDQNEMEEKIFRKKFNEYDKDKSGTLDAKELSDFITDLGIYVPEEDMPGLVTSLDTKGDGKLTFNKLQAWFKKVNAKADDLPPETDGGKKKKGRK